jgi:hypothetical protein
MQQKSASGWNNTWILLENVIVDRLIKEMRKKYQKLDKKQDKVTKTLNVDFNSVVLDD